MTSIRKFIPLVLALAITTAGCGTGLLTSFRIALASSGPLVDSLVAAGVIRQDQAAPIISDFSDAAQAAIVLQSDLKAAGTDKALKAAAVVKFAKAWREIYARGHFGVNPKIQRAADIAESIVESLELYYGARIQPAVHTTAPRTDAQLEAQLKLQVKELQAAMKP